MAGNTLIEELPKDFGNLENLQTVDLKYTLIHKLPDSFSKLRVSQKYKICLHIVVHVYFLQS